MRDDKPFGGAAAPAAVYHYSPTREAAHPEAHLATYAGICQADAYSGYGGLYAAGRRPGPIVEAACCAHGRRKFFELAELQKAPIAIEAVRRIDHLLAIEREINGQPPDARLAARQAQSRPLVAALGEWSDQFERWAVRLAYPVALTSSRTLNITLDYKHIAQVSEAVDFDVKLSRHRYSVVHHDGAGDGLRRWMAVSQRPVTEAA